MIKQGFKYFVIFLIGTFIVCASLIVPSENELSDLRVAKVLAILGDEGPDHYPNTKEFGVSAKRGEALVKKGFSSRPGGGKTRKQSKHFVCTSCHNVEKEDPDLRYNDPQKRLEYTNDKGLPFLQGTSLYGAVNRESFYNDDYFKKYGELVTPARNNIRASIQLCAVECAQGRKLKKWELESILAYLWTIDLKLSDLSFENGELDYVYAALDNEADQDSAVEIVKSKYLTSSAAHFTTAGASMDLTKNIVGNPDNGKMIYDNSCMHCHADRKYSFFNLDYDKLTFKHLAKKAHGYGRHSLYQVTRYGVYSRSGKRSYMPQYPIEKMSDQQLMDLRAYIEQQAD